MDRDKVMQVSILLYDLKVKGEFKGDYKNIRGGELRSETDFPCSPQ